MKSFRFEEYDRNRESWWMGKRFSRYETQNEPQMTQEGISMMEKMLNDADYERKVSEVMAIMQGRRIVGKQGFNSPVWRD